MQAQRSSCRCCRKWRGRAAPRCWRRCASGGGATGSIAACCKGPLADHIVFHPWDALPRRLEEADACCAGASAFMAQTVDVPDGVSVFDLHAAQRRPGRRRCTLSPGCRRCPPPAATMRARAGHQPDRANGSSATATIPSRPGRRTSWRGGWSHIFCHGRLVILNSEMMWRSRLFVSLREQCQNAGAHLRRGARRPAAAGSGRGAGAVGPVPGRQPQAAARRAWRALESEIERQILPDGGHVSRSPEALLSAYRHLMMVMEALSAVDEEPPHALRNAHDRMAPMLRFFRHGDGALALFNGGAESDAAHDRGPAGARRRARPAFPSCPP